MLGKFEARETWQWDGPSLMLDTHGGGVPASILFHSQIARWGLGTASRGPGGLDDRAFGGMRSAVCTSYLAQYQSKQASFCL